MLSIGYDIGSSSIKAAVLDINSGELVSNGYYPENELEILSPHPGFAEQNPEVWWDCVKNVTKIVLEKGNIKGEDIKCIGISYQMHGLVTVDKNRKVIRPAIIWCDSRAVDTGNKAFNKIGKEYCLEHLLNSPGNFTASKLRWVIENEPEIYEQVYKFMLPGDFIAMKLTGEIVTTVPGLSEGIFWDFKKKAVSKKLLNLYKIDNEKLPAIKPTFGEQGKLDKKIAAELGLNSGIPVSYRAGDQPNNAFSLNVLNSGEIAATAGTSGVIYGVTDSLKYDSKSRVNQFAHVNYSAKNPLIGILLCINGTGILNSWIRKNFGNDLTYDQMNKFAETINIGSDGVSILPFGNGAERVLENKKIGCSIFGLDFNRHSRAHVFRAAQEGIAFSMKYGMNIMKKMGLEINIIRAGKANLFLSNIFAQTISDLSGAVIQLYNTDGAQGAARGAAVGAGYYSSLEEAFRNLTICNEFSPKEKDQTLQAYKNWLANLKSAV